MIPFSSSVMFFLYDVSPFTFLLLLCVSTFCTLFIISCNQLLLLLFKNPAVQTCNSTYNCCIQWYFCCHLSIRTDDCTSLTFPLQLLNILSFVNFQLYYLFMFLNQLVNFLVIFIDSCLCYDCRGFIMLSWAWLCWEPYLLLLLLLNI
jgi:hypothetical protein